MEIPGMNIPLKTKKCHWLLRLVISDKVIVGMMLSVFLLQYQLFLSKNTGL